jgi:hypothetical protein
VTPVLALYVRPYDFKNDRGEQIAGFTLEYLELDQDPTDHQGGAKGLTVFKDTMDTTALPDFSVMPGLYELSHTSARDAKGRKVLRVSGGRLVGKVDLSKLLVKQVQA